MRPLALAGLLLAGCAEVIGADDYKVAGSDGTCAPQVGSFNFHFDEHDGGGCGPLADRIVALNTEGATGPLRLPDNCSGSDAISANHCIETIATTCTAPDLRASTVAGSITYSADGRSGGGIWQVELRDPMGKLLCGSVYTVTVTKVG